MASARPNSVDVDKPRIHLSAKELDKEAGAGTAPEAYVYQTRAGKRITFPDPYEMDFEQAEEFLAKIESFSNSREALTEWVGADGFEAIQKDHLTLRQMLLLVQRVQQHYVAFMGSPGEDAPSSS